MTTYRLTGSLPPSFQAGGLEWQVSFVEMCGGVACVIHTAHESHELCWAKSKKRVLEGLKAGVDLPHGTTRAFLLGRLVESGVMEMLPPAASKLAAR